MILYEGITTLEQSHQPERLQTTQNDPACDSYHTWEDWSVPVGGFFPRNCPKVMQVSMDWLRENLQETMFFYHQI